MQSTNLSQDDAALDGPDYLALIIEWDDNGEPEALLMVEPSPEPRRAVTIRTIAAVLGALGAVMFATWAVRRLRAA